MILAAAATFDEMSATVGFKKFRDLGSRDFRRDERALRCETSKRLHPGEFLLGFRPRGQLHLGVDYPWLIAQDRHVRRRRRAILSYEPGVVDTEMDRKSTRLNSSH